MLKNAETAGLLKSRWDALPDHLKLDNQVVGRYWVQCGYTMGPSYCSFGCSHCYLPTNANRVPLVDMAEMKAQIEANRRFLGKGGPIQVTGGDVVDAYVRAGREDELIEIVAYCVELDLVPMLMTHGQGLLDNPELLEALVLRGGLSKLSCHIDITQAGRPGFPIRELQHESQLHPLRDQLVDLVLMTRKKTRKPLVAAQTVTVAQKNIHSIAAILEWLVSRPRNMDVTRTISFQTEAEIGRTLNQDDRVTPDMVWERICRGIGQPLPRDHLVFGHPDCTSTATLVVRSRDRRVINLDPGNDVSREFWCSLIEKFGGLQMGGKRRFLNNAIKLAVVFRHPGLLWQWARYLVSLTRHGGLTAGMMISLVSGRAKGFNLVMHNFMSEEQVARTDDAVVRDRLAACSFRGAVKQDGEWIAVSMCEMNANLRPQIYAREIGNKKVRAGNT